MMKAKLLQNGLYYGTAILISLIFILPLFWMLSASLRQPGLPPSRTIEWIPNPVTWENYLTIFQIIPLERYILNSCVVAGMAIPLTVLTASLTGFGIAELGARVRGLLFTLTVGLLLVPGSALWLTRYMLLSWLGITDSYLALIAPAFMGTSPLFILLYYWTFRRIPVEVFESARLDGAGAFSVWWRIGLPQSRPTSMAVTILAFMFYWNDFINPLLYLKSQSLYTLAVGVQQLQQLDKTNWPILLAAAVVMTLPTLLLFGGLQRFFLSEERLSGIMGR